MIESGAVADLMVGADVEYVLECRLLPAWTTMVDEPTLPGLVHEQPITVVGQVEQVTLVAVQAVVAVLNRLDATTVEPGQRRHHWLTFSPYQARLRTLLGSHQTVSTQWSVAQLWEFDRQVAGGAMRPLEALPAAETLDARPAALFAVDLYPADGPNR